MSHAARAEQAIERVIKHTGLYRSWLPVADAESCAEFAERIEREIAAACTENRPVRIEIGDAVAAMSMAVVYAKAYTKPRKL